MPQMKFESAGALVCAISLPVGAHRAEFVYDPIYLKIYKLFSARHARCAPSLFFAIYETGTVPRGML